MDEDIQKIDEAILAAAVDGKIACPQALKIAAEYGVEGKFIGAACNRLGIKIRGCQLGCFP